MFAGLGNRCGHTVYGVDVGRDTKIMALHAEGRSVRQIAGEVGLSPSMVHKIIGKHLGAAGQWTRFSAPGMEADPLEDPAVSWDDDDDAEDERDRERARLRELAADNPDPRDVVEPLRFVGCTWWRDSFGRPVAEDRVVDARGRSLNSLGLYRLRQFYNREVEDPERLTRMHDSLESQRQRFGCTGEPGCTACVGLGPRLVR